MAWPQADLLGCRSPAVAHGILGNCSVLVPDATLPNPSLDSYLSPSLASCTSSPACRVTYGKEAFDFINSQAAMRYLG